MGKRTAGNKEPAQREQCGNTLVMAWREHRALQVPTTVNAVTLQIPERAQRARGGQEVVARERFMPAEACVSQGSDLSKAINKGEVREAETFGSHTGMMEGM